MIELVARTTMILVAAWLGSHLLRRATATTRHLLWQCAIVAVLAAPVAGYWVPRIELPLPGGSTEAVARGALTSVRSALSGEVTSSARALAAPAPLRGNQPPRPGASRALGAVWPAGSAAVALWFAIAHLAASTRHRHGRPASIELASEAARVAAALGLDRQPALRIAPDEGPFTVGLFRPTIVLPAAAETWSRDRQRAVLLHELAHVRRGDCLTQTIAHVACAAYWFNPLVWLAARALRRTREQACDDEVLRHGVQASAYAADVLDVARTMQARITSPAAVAMARSSELEARLLAILSHHRPRVPAPATRWLVAAGVALVALLSVAGETPSGATSGTASPAAAASTSPAGEDRERATIRLALDSAPEAIPALIEALKDADPQVREKAALGLGWRNDPRVVAPLVTALADSSSQVREKAAIALGTTGDPRAAEALQAALGDPAASVREKASAGLLLLQLGGSQDRSDRVREALRLVFSGLTSLAR